MEKSLKWLAGAAMAFGLVAFIPGRVMATQSGCSGSVTCSSGSCQCTGSNCKFYCDIAGHPHCECS